MPTSKKFAVSYRDDSVEGVSSSVVANLEDVMKACYLALNIHQSSNVKHTIKVFDLDSEYVVLCLILD